VTVTHISVSSESLTDATRKSNCVRPVMQHSLTQSWKPPEFDIDWETPVVILKLGLTAKEAFHFFLNRRQSPVLMQHVTQPAICRWLK